MSKLLKTLSPFFTTAVTSLVGIMSFLFFGWLIEDHGPHMIIYGGRSLTAAPPGGAWTLEWDAAILRHDCKATVSAFYARVDNTTPISYPVAERSMAAKYTDGKRKLSNVTLMVPSYIRPGTYTYRATILSDCSDGDHVIYAPEIVMEVAEK